MFHHYVPILKTKQGEFNGLKEMEDALAQGMTPLFEILPEMFNVTKTRPNAKSIDKNIVGTFRKGWERDSPFFLDGKYLPPLLLKRLPAIAQAISDEGGSVIPVTGPERNTKYQAVARQIVQQMGGGICFRVPLADGLDIDALNNDLSLLCHYHGVGPHEVHLVLDLGSIGHLVPFMAQALTMTANRIAWLADWKTYTIAATGYPNVLTIPPGQNGLLKRREWLLWKQLVQEESATRIPDFGDYTINSPALLEFDPLKMKLSAKIRYTTDEDWLAIKGRQLKGNGGQFHRLARQLVERVEYCGPMFSAGDKYILECANHQQGPGNPMTWVRVGVNHHMTFVVKQLASLPAP